MMTLKTSQLQSSTVEARRPWNRRRNEPLYTSTREYIPTAVEVDKPEAAQSCWLDRFNDRLDRTQNWSTSAERYQHVSTHCNAEASQSSFQPD